MTTTMRGSGYYGAHTAGARAVAETSSDLLMEAAASVNIPNGRPMLIADYGAADGLNSAESIRSTIRRLRQRAPGRAIQVVYTDQPDNDYSALFRWLHRPPGQAQSQRYVDEFGDVFVSAIGNSFYQQLLPSGTVDLGFSATAMHWLSGTPATIPDHVHAVGAEDGQLAAFRDLARRDWETLLLHRASELAPGGFLVVANLCVDERGRFVGNTGRAGVFDTFQLIWRSLRDDNLVSEDEYRAATFPQYYRTLSELRAPMLDPASPVRKAGLRLLRCSTHLVACPHATDFERHRDPVRFADAYVPSLRAWSEGVFLAALEQRRPQADRRDIVDELYGRYHHLVRTNPADHRLDYVHAYMLMKGTKGRPR